MGEGKIMSRRAFLKIAGVTAASLLLPGCSEKKKFPSSWINIEAGDSGETFTTLDKKNIDKVTTVWEEKFGKPKRGQIKISPFKPIIYQKGSNQYEDVERAAAGYIKVAQGSNILSSLVAHALTHAIPPNEPTLLPKPWEIPEVNGGGEILGWHGAAILIKLRNGEQVHWREMEEAFCELHRMFVLKEGSYINQPYLQAEQFIESKIKLDQSPITVKLIENNNVPELLKLLFNFDPATLTLNQLMLAMATFNRILPDR